MKTTAYNTLIGVATIIAAIYRTSRRLYRRFCIKFLWRRLNVETSVYRQWHDRRAAKIQAELDRERDLRFFNIYPETF